MTTNDTLKFIRGHYEFINRNPWCPALEGYQKYVEGLIVMATAIGIISYSDGVSLKEELEEIVQKAIDTAAA